MTINTVLIGYLIKRGNKSKIINFFLKCLLLLKVKKKEFKFKDTLIVFFRCNLMRILPFIGFFFKNCRERNIVYLDISFEEGVFFVDKMVCEFVYNRLEKTLALRLFVNLKIL